MQLSSEWPSGRGVAWIGVAILVAAIGLVYGRAIDSPFVFDDRTSIVDNPSIRQLWPPWGDSVQPGPLQPPRSSPTAARPLVNLTFAINYRLGGLNPAGYHLVNFALHLLSAALVMGIVSRTLMLDLFSGRFIGTAQPLGFFAALVWALHPLNTEAVIYVTQRTELLVGLCYLATVYASIRYWTSTTIRCRRGWLAAAIVACSAGMASKEVMVTAPIVVRLYDRCFIGGSFREALRRSRPLYLGLAYCWLLLALLNVGGPRAASAGFHLDFPKSVYWCTQAKVLWMYLKLAIWPWPLSIHYDLPYVKTTGAAIPWLLATAALVIVTMLLLAKRSSVGFVAASVLLILSPTLIVPILSEQAAERRMYLPLAALVALAVVGAYRVASANRARALPLVGAVALVLALVYGGISAQRLQAFSSPVTLWQTTLTAQPDDAIAHYNLAVALGDDGKATEAIEHYRTAAQLQPAYVEPRNNLGVILTQRGRADEAITPLREVAELAPDYCDGHNNLGNALAAAGKLPEALDQFAEALRLDPDNATAYYDRGVALARAGQNDQAIDDFQHALRLRPDHAEAHNNLGVALLSQGRTAEGIEQLAAAARLRPNYVEAHDNLATTLVQSGRTADALPHFEKVVQLQPDSPVAQARLAMAYAELDRSPEAIAAAERAIKVARAKNDRALSDQMEAWLDSYRAGQPRHSEADQTLVPPTE